MIKYLLCFMLFFSCSTLYAQQIVVPQVVLVPQTVVSTFYQPVVTYQVYDIQPVVQVFPNVTPVIVQEKRCWWWENRPKYIYNVVPAYGSGYYNTFWIPKY